jgi:SNF2 family DNA or RNA helicase
MASEGTIRFADNVWKIEAKAHVLYRAEKALLNAKRVENSVIVPATPEGARDVFWFSRRFDIKVLDAPKLRSETAKYVLSQGQAERILAGNFKVSESGFRSGKKPRQYQTQGAKLFQAVGGLLVADQLGLGKTVTGGMALIDPKLRPSIIVSPSHLSDQWQDKIHEFFVGMRTHIIKQQSYYDLPKYRLCQDCNIWSMQSLKNGQVRPVGTCRKCQHTVSGEAADADVILISYNKLHYWVDILGQIAKSVIFDECHELRRAESKKYAAAKRLSEMVDYRLGLSATPVANLGGEMYNIIDCLRPGMLGQKSDFRRTWCESYGAPGKEPALSDPAAFGDYLRAEHLMIRRTRQEVGRELPEHTRIVQKIEHDLVEVDKIRGKAGDLARMILSKTTSSTDRLNASGQLESLIRQQTAIAKAPYVAAFVEMLLEQDIPTILFGYHRTFYEIVTSKLRDFNPLMYTGSETPERKREMKDRFIAGDSNLLIVSLRSGAGLDGLQARGATGVFGELDWSPAIHSQCEGRYHRDGQSQPCLSYYLVADYGLDPVMTQVLGVKRAQSSALLQAHGDGEISKQSAKYVQELAQRYLSGQV